MQSVCGLYQVYEDSRPILFDHMLTRKSDFPGIWEVYCSKCGKPYYFYKDDGAERLYLDATYMVCMQKMRQNT
ncbi:uncharacterized protein LACBIDRAFT_304587 [Laccaria bicolor S238N-H82]|uniref:Predicted protein n=1 Tax=Laccaria bicolor (strain S238N-H82 / ATCC MYA-4686) TaxID=486041 RepID=B0DLY5_LACBS|nr:uncharacterized protein LACBIDRAFT_304584 [Laccaria bicolor S238N-H82]XP_001884995.1 uncharacterized protein LACBIDRAFT_304587 [Laccaria bicolor S238N-H82]EDR04475.1 predicted protein [Laccaria bicolor S238N-H82]EDR04476.1 predicted protein [Laccaria bicolor S238N-H82]|eukprot:XP_001884994.1 predicted protein [Laccaria bicolor S238N-H82]